MSKMRAYLKIELQSDLCASSGYAYAGVIDSDVAYDEHGIPYIPARRLKGCMREAGEMIHVSPERLEMIFGKSGDTGTKGMTLENAYIETYQDITKELRALTCAEQDVAKLLNQQNILRLYTSVRAQTEIEQESGTANRNSLRFLRVVGQYDPLKAGQNLCFYAKIEFDSGCKDELLRIAKATRNIGLNRNRGFGSVRCSIEWAKEISAQVASSDCQKEGRACITYILRNREPLLMSGSSNGTSDSYISGKSVLGKLAGEYLRQPGKNGDSEEFQELFLKGGSLFTDANITFPPKEGRESAAAWPSFDPAPLCLNRLKKSKELVNLLGKKIESAEQQKNFNMENGNLPKKLKTQYVCRIKNESYAVAEAERELVYHSNRGEEQLLYSVEVLKSGQYFKGQIYTDWKYADLLAGLLKNAGLSFGQSKTAQYGACELAATVSVDNAHTIPFSISGGRIVAVTLCSDSIFMNENGYTVKFGEVKKLIAERLKIPYVEKEDQESLVQTVEVTGYNTTWNLKRQAVPAIRAGSVFVYLLTDNWSGEEEAFVGERNLEGYGKVRLRDCGEMVYQAEECDISQSNGEYDAKLNVCRPFLRSILPERVLEELTENYVANVSSGLKMSASTLGRLTLMLKESLQEFKGDDRKAFEDFCGRVDSIKRESEKKEAQNLIGRTLGKELKAMKKAASEGGFAHILQTCGERESERCIESLWGDYMMNILTWHKYQKKNSKDAGKEGKRE